VGPAVAPGNGNGNGKGPAAKGGPVVQVDQGKGKTSNSKGGPAASDDEGNGNGDGPAALVGPIVAQVNQAKTSTAPGHSEESAGASDDQGGGLVAQLKTEPLVAQQDGEGNAQVALPAKGKTDASVDAQGGQGLALGLAVKTGNPASPSSGKSGGLASRIDVQGQDQTLGSLVSSPVLVGGQTSSTVAANSSGAVAKDEHEGSVTVAAATTLQASAPLDNLGGAVFGPAGQAAAQAVKAGVATAVPGGPSGVARKDDRPSVGANLGGDAPKPLVVLPSDSEGMDRAAAKSSHAGNRSETAGPVSSVSPLNQSSSPFSTLTQGRLDHGSRGAQDRSSGGADNGAHAGIAGVARAGAGALERIFDQGEETPLEADRLAESLSFDPAALDQAIARYLDRIDDLGDVLSDVLRPDRLSPWLQGTALATVACIAARRWNRKRSDSSLGEDGEDVTPSWLIELRSGPETM